MPDSAVFSVMNRDESLVIKADSGQIGQILLNLCLNARDALEGRPGTVEVTVSHTLASTEDWEALPVNGGKRTDDASRVAIGVVVPGHSYAKITVCDSGAGIPQPVLDKIFEPFFTTKQRSQGTGLGLSVVHGILLEHDGCCVVESRPGVGSVFTVYLPVSNEGIEATYHIDPNVLGHERVLFVDDEVALLDAIAQGLERFGYRITTQSDSSNAYRLFQANPSEWEVVIADQIMPGIQGIELIRKLKEIRPDLLCILCTGFIEGATEDDAHQAGVDVLLSKPVSAEELAAAIRRFREQGFRTTDSRPQPSMTMV
jgi:CheY-like chemotaxis protein